MVQFLDLGVVPVLCNDKFWTVQKARVQRHTVEHITDLVRVAPMVQILDAPVPQTGEQLPDILSFFDALMPVPEQVIEVPKILLDDVPMRAAARDTQRNSWWKCRRSQCTLLWFSPRRSFRGERFDELLQGWRVEGVVHVEVFKVLVLDRIQQRI